MTLRLNSDPICSPKNCNKVSDIPDKIYIDC